MTLEFIGPVNMYLAMFVKMSTAVILGTFIGIERERRLQRAGLKTHILILLGTTVFSMMPFLITENQELVAGRITSQIISGIGFLGGGAILKVKSDVFGLTSAATIWVTAALGILIGWGYPFTATFLTIIVILVLKYSSILYKLYTGQDDFYLEIVGHGQESLNIESLVSTQYYHIYSREFFRDEKRDKFILIYTIKINPRDLMKLTNKIKNINFVQKIDYRYVRNPRSVSV